MLPNFNELLDYCEKKFNKIYYVWIYGKCAIKIYVNPTKNDYPDLSSFVFDTIDELKCAFKEFLKKNH